MTSSAVRSTSVVPRGAGVKAVVRRRAGRHGVRRTRGSTGPAPTGARRTAPATRSDVPAHRDNDGIIPVLARTVREVEAAVQRGRVLPSVRTKFQVVALLVREERARVRADETSSRGPAGRAAQAPRRDRD